MKILEIQHLHISFGDLEIVRDVSFTLEEGQWLMIVGPNGAGKSTILNAISRGVPYRGEILFRDTQLSQIKTTELAKHIGILAQNHAVGYDFTVQEVVNLGRYAYRHGMLQGNSEEDADAVSKAIEAAGLSALAQKSVLHLSGGEVQRTFLAQLFAQNPDIMILDEPANHLDLIYQKQVFELISTWLQQPGRAVISVVHDLSLAKAYGTHCVLLHHGQNVAFGKAAEVLTPEHLQSVYEMDVYEWMRTMLGQWQQ